MAIWPFNRKKDKSGDLPQEVQAYYQAEKREKVGVAGLLALGTLLVTILVAIGLFFGGRWVYRTVFDNGSDNVAVQNDQNQDQEEAPAEDQPDEPEAAPAPAAPSTPSRPTELPSDQPNPQPSAPAPSNEDLPSTGPADTLAIFVATVVLAAVAHNFVSDRRVKQ